jgi:hypothetical protein
MSTRQPIFTTEGEGGGAVIEFMFSTLIWVPLLLGVIGIGTELVREIEVTQVCRDAAHMYAYGVDFSQSSSQQLVLQAAPSGLGLAQTGGNGAIILSTIRVISAADCQAGGLQPESQHCPNLNLPVFTNQIVIGSTSLKSSFDNPNPPPTDSTGAVSQNTTLTSTSDQTPLLTQLLPSLAAGQVAYVGEVFVNNSDLAWTGFGGSVITSRSIF